jgi:glycosyltransferase involved in cell wall biosynthesis
MVTRLELEGLVRFTGMLSSPEVARVLQGADLMLFPSRNEGFGLVAAEALIAGVPVVVCTDGGGVSDVVPETGAGRRVSPQPGQIAAAALELLDDPDARDAARELGRIWRKRLDPAVVAERCEAWYREAMSA